MRLLNTKTLEFKWFDDPTSVKYAILSHVWAEEGEQSYKEVCALLKRARRLPNSELHNQISQKVRRFCARALQDGYAYVWIDSCCIDKSDSAEQSEAINSMYQWYASATRCYVFLHDVQDGDNPRALTSQFRRSVWFTRGWTLQELIAPSILVFLSKKWNPIGTKQSLACVVEEVTGIDVAILKGTCSLRDVSVSRRMSWAAHRRTRREEDEAYCLLGLFGIHMVPTYGEKRHAFVRLQEAILQHVPDDTLFAWGARLPLSSPADVQALEGPRDSSVGAKRLFAATPKDFEATADLRPIAHRMLLQRLGLEEELESCPPPTYSATRFGFRVELPLMSFQQRGTRRSSIYKLAEVKIGFLLCEDADNRLVGMIIRPPSFQSQTRIRSDGSMNALRVGACSSETQADGEWVDYRLVTLTEDVLADFLKSHRISVSAVHILIKETGSIRRPNSTFSGSGTVPSLRTLRSERRRLSYIPPSPCRIQLSEVCKLDLAEQGIAVREILSEPPSTSLPDYYRRVMLVFYSEARQGAISIVLGHCEHCGRRKTSSPGRDLRVQVQSPASSNVSWSQLPEFRPHRPSENDYDHIHFWPSWDGVACMEYTLRGPDPRMVQVIRLAVSWAEPPRTSVLEVSVKLTERRVRGRMMPERTTIGFSPEQVRG